MMSATPFPLSAETIIASLQTAPAPQREELLAKILDSRASSAEQLALGNFFASSGKFDEAAAFYEAALRNGNDAGALRRLARVEFLRGNLIRAGVLYDRVLRESPGDTGALVGRAEAELALGQFGAARGTLAALRAQLAEAGHGADATAIRLADLCEHAIAKAAGHSAPVAVPDALSPATGTADAATPGSLVRRVQQAEDDYNLDRSSLLIMLKRQGQLIDRLQQTVAQLLKRLYMAH